MDRQFVPPSQHHGQDQPRTSWNAPRHPTSRWVHSQWQEEEDWEGWYQSDTESARSQSNSPRQRLAPRRPKKSQGDGKGRSSKSQKGAPKGSGKGKGNYKGKEIAPPPWASSTATTAALPVPASTTQQQSKAEAKLHEIVAAMKKKDSLDPELARLAQEGEQLQNQNTTSKLMSAVSKHGDAKYVLIEARQARAHLHASWKQYLDAAIATWRGFLEDFDKEDRKLEEQIEQAELGLTTAQENLDEAKKAATEAELKDQIEVVDDDMELMDKTMRSGPAIRAGLSGMLEGLEKLQAKTEEETGDLKRQRLDDGTSKPSSTAAALQPFARAGH